MEQWEYLPTYLEAQAKNKDIKAFLKEQMPERKKFPRYMAQAMIPELNELGAQGWELVHMEPVPGLGNKGDVKFNGSGSWSNVYFCIFKRRKSIPTVMPLDANGQPAFSSQPKPQPQQPTQAQYPPAQVESSGD